MQKPITSLLLALSLVTALPSNAFSADDDLSGFTLRQLDEAIATAGLGTQKIYSILTFDSDSRAGANIAILSGSHAGWRVTVLHRIKGSLKAEWQSSKLPDDINVSSSKHLEIDYMDDGEQVVVFSGCAAHACGGLDGVFGMLLYSPRSRQIFFAHYRYDGSKPSGAFGSLDFSENALATGNKKYKQALQKAMNGVLGQ